MRCASRDLDRFSSDFSEAGEKTLRFFPRCLLTQNGHPIRRTLAAQMAELVDAPASGAGSRKGVEVRVLFWAPIRFLTYVDQKVKPIQTIAHWLLCNNGE